VDPPAAAPPDELELPEGWTLKANGLSRDGLHALDVQIGLDAEGLIALPGIGTVPPEPDEWSDSYADWTLHYLAERGANFDALGPDQLALLRELLRDLDFMRDETAPDLDLGKLFTEYLAAIGQSPPRRGAVSGRRFILDIPADPPALWGDGKRVLWSRGEGLMLYAPQGVGKTSLAQQLVNARIGIGQGQLLGLPVLPARRVLYLALDRPPQIARSHRRMVRPEHADLLEERLVVWQGPLPFRLDWKDPGLLTRWARDAHDVDCVVVDSYKNIAASLSSEETGALIDLVAQEALAEGLDWLALHHPRKSNAENKKPNTLDDVYGSTWLTAGMGSVLGLWGKAGDTLIEFTHLKQPADPVGPLVLLHDHDAGSTSVLSVGGGTGKKAEREKAVIARYLQQGGPGAVLTLEDVEDLGSENTMRPILQELTERGLLAYKQGGGSEKSTWTMTALKLASGS
jgi:AAA domain